MSSITYRPQHIQSVTETNDLLRANQFLHDYELISNDNINTGHIWRDKIHLNNNGVILLANNLIKAINRKHIA